MRFFSDLEELAKFLYHIEQNRLFSVETCTNETDWQIYQWFHILMPLLNERMKEMGFTKELINHYKEQF